MCIKSKVIILLLSILSISINGYSQTKEERYIEGIKLLKESAHHTYTIDSLKWVLEGVPPSSMPPPPVIQDELSQQILSTYGNLKSKSVYESFIKIMDESLKASGKERDDLLYQVKQKEGAKSGLVDKLQSSRTELEMLLKENYGIDNIADNCDINPNTKFKFVGSFEYECEFCEGLVGVSDSILQVLSPYIYKYIEIKTDGMGRITWGNDDDVGIFIEPDPWGTPKKSCAKRNIDNLDLEVTTLGIRAKYQITTTKGAKILTSIEDSTGTMRGLRINGKLTPMTSKYIPHDLHYYDLNGNEISISDDDREKNNLFKSIAGVRFTGYMVKVE